SEADDLAGERAAEEVVGGRLAADDGEPEPPARLDRGHARVAADRVAGEEHDRDLSVDHRLHRDAHRGLLPAPAAGRPIADRAGRVEARPAVAHRVADVLQSPDPQEALLLSGEGRVLTALSQRARPNADG